MKQNSGAVWSGRAARRPPVKSATDKLGKSQQRWLRDNRGRLQFPFKLVEVRKMELEVLAGA
jgi:hypothetical protein